MTLAELTNKIGFTVNENDVRNVTQTFSKIKSTATKVLGVIGIGLSLANMNELIEDFAGVKALISSSTSGLGDQAEIQQKILDSATKLRAEYADTAKMVSNLVKENKDLFADVDEAIAFNEATTMLFKTAGKTNEEISGLMESINKSFAKGYVDSETVSKLLEKSPEAVELLNKRLGTTSAQLEQMARSGTFTLQDLKAAFMDNAAQIEKSYGTVKLRVSDALTVIRNKWGLWLSDTDDALGATNSVGALMVKGFDAALRAVTRLRNGIIWLTEKMGGLKNLYKVIGGLVVAAFGYKAINSVVAFAKALKGAERGSIITKLKILGVLAALLLLATVIEDVVVFMKGGDSLLGDILERAGVDCDKFRENVKKIWANLQTALTAIWTGIKNVAIPIFQGIWSVIKAAFEAIGKVIGAIMPSFADLFDQLANGNVNVEQWTEFGEALAQIATVIVGVIAVVKVLTAVEATLNAVMAASPITWIIVGIVALIAAIVLLVKNWDKVKEAASKCWDWIVGVFSKAENWWKANVTDPIANFFSGLWESIKSGVKVAWDWIVGIFVGAATWYYNTVTKPVADFFTGLWDGIKTGVSSAWDWIVGVFAGAAAWWNENVIQPVAGFFTGLWESITGTVGKIKDSIVSGLTAAIEWIKALPKEALTWGRDIILAIVNGIKSAIGKVGDAVGEIAGKIKSFLGFSEPEDGPLSNFHTYMPDMIDLLITGIQSGKDKVRKALAELTGGMALDMDLTANVRSLLGNLPGEIIADLSAFSAGAKVSPATASTIMNSSTTRTINQSVVFNQQFTGDKAIQKQAAVATQKAAKDVTGELARGLAYARG